MRCERMWKRGRLTRVNILVQLLSVHRCDYELATLHVTPAFGLVGELGPRQDFIFNDSTILSQAIFRITFKPQTH